MPFLSRLCHAFAKQRLRYALVGGHAVALHGAVRGTIDIDIALAWSLRSLQRAERALAKLGLVSRLPIDAEDVFRFRGEYIKNRNLIAWNFFNPDNLTERVDIIINYDLKGKQIQQINTAHGPLWLLSRNDLIVMKRCSGRPQDLADVDALERLG